LPFAVHFRLRGRVLVELCCVSQSIFCLNNLANLVQHLPRLLSQVAVVVLAILEFKAFIITCHAATAP